MTCVALHLDYEIANFLKSVTVRKMQKGISADYQLIGEIGMNQNERATKQAETAMKMHINEELFKSGKITKSMYEFAKKQFLKDIAA